MEIEAWFLSMYSLYEKVNSNLTLTYIKENLRYNLKKIDPEKKFYRPVKEVCKIYNLCNLTYDKSKNTIEALTSNISYEDVKRGMKDNRCNSLRIFFDELLGLGIPLLRKNKLF